MSDDVTIPRSALGYVGMMGMPRGRAPRRGGGPNSAAAYVEAKKRDKRRRAAAGDGPSTPGEDLIARRHPDWSENFLRWRFLLDSLEGGQRYRNATYGMDRSGRPVRNLHRHKREYPDPAEFPNTYQGWGGFAGASDGLMQAAGIGPFPGQLGADPLATADDDDYELRRAATPPPEFVGNAIELHLAKIYDQQVRRGGPPELVAWWADVDGAGTSIDDWMREELSPSGLAMATIDLCFDRPVIPAGVELLTRQDDADYGQETVVASIIVPENMVWYEMDPGGNYLECLVCEHNTPDDPSPDGDTPPSTPNTDSGEPVRRDKDARKWRHWTATDVTLYDGDGEILEGPRPHGYPFIPVRRLVDKRRLRTPHVGKSRYEAIAELQRAYYNRDSELIYSDGLQAHPALSGPSEYCKPEQTISYGPDKVLPKYQDAAGHLVEWSFVSPPKDPAESLRKSKQDIEDLKDRHAGLTKPAGMTGTTGGTVSQSGFSKMFDAEDGARILGSIARTLARWERSIAEFALACILRRPLAKPERASIHVVYPSRFQLKTGAAILDELSKLVPSLTMEAQLVSGVLTSGGGTAPPPSADPSQEGGNPTGPAPAAPTDGRTAGPNRVAPMGVKASDFAPSKIIACPTIVAELFRQYSEATFVGGKPELFSQIDRELETFLTLHSLPDIGTEDDDESMAGPGSEEQLAQQDRMGVSASTMVSNMTAIT